MIQHAHQSGDGFIPCWIDSGNWYYWFGSADLPTCRAVLDHVRLIEAADLRYPIILSQGGRVMDGMHRVSKAVLLGRSTIDAVRFVVDPVPDHVDVHPDDLPYDEIVEPPVFSRHLPSS